MRSFEFFFAIRQVCRKGGGEPNAARELGWADWPVDSGAVSDGVDYISDEAAVRTRIEDLTRRANTARAEARHAREHPGLDGVVRNAESLAASCEGAIAELREIAIRTARGYDWWDKELFEIALDAYADPWTWRTLAEVLDRDVTFSHHDDELHLPIDAQRAYGDAFTSGLFNRYEMCLWFDTEADPQTFLFGVTDFKQLGPCLFLVTQWESASG